MKFLPVRLALWLLALAVFPIPLPLLSQSFQVEILQRITLDTLPQERTLGLDREWTERVLLHLEQAEKKEVDPWLRDDLRIAWITVSWAQNGVPDWSLHRDQPPYVAATWQVLHCPPGEVWPRILAARQFKLGVLYPQVWGGTASPRKPVRSVGRAELEQRRFEQRNKAA